MRMAWMPSASSSATTTMIASSSSVPPAAFLRLALLATGVFAVIRGLPLPCFRLVAAGPRLYRPGHRLPRVRLLLGLRVGLGHGLDGRLPGLVGAVRDRLPLVEQARLDRLVRAQVAPPGHAGALAHAAAQVA